MTHPEALGVEMSGGGEGDKEAVAGVDMEEVMKGRMEEAGEGGFGRQAMEEGVERAEGVDMAGAIVDDREKMVDGAIGVALGEPRLEKWK